MPNNAERKATAEAAFRARITELGARFADGAVYLNNRTAVDLICAAGHACAPRPDHVQSGQGICDVCGRCSRTAAEAVFRARIAELGARFADGAVYLNARTAVKLICAAGHACARRPDQLRKSRSVCRVCSRKDSATARAAFWARVAEMGGRRAPGGRYVRSGTPVDLICAAGHVCSPKPNHVQQGQGICDRCAATFERVYLLVHPRAGAVKVGVAGGDRRVRDHRRHGYRLIAQWTGLEHDSALAVEAAVVSRWRAAGIAPVATAPKDGRTETAPTAHLFTTRAHLGELLGAPDGAHEVTGEDALLAAA